METNAPELDLLDGEEKTLTDLNPLTPDEIQELEMLANCLKTDGGE
jgi:hypothetical protein